MEKFFTIKFYYRGKLEHCTVKMRQQEDISEYCITVLNGDLERLLFGNHIIKEQYGKLQIDLPSQNSNLARLKCAVAYALSEHLKEKASLASVQNN